MESLSKLELKQKFLENELEEYENRQKYLQDLMKETYVKLEKLDIRNPNYATENSDLLGQISEIRREMSVFNFNLRKSEVEKDMERLEKRKQKCLRVSHPNVVIEENQNDSNSDLFNDNDDEFPIPRRKSQRILLSHPNITYSDLLPKSSVTHPNVELNRSSRRLTTELTSSRMSKSISKHSSQKSKLAFAEPENRLCTNCRDNKCSARAAKCSIRRRTPTGYPVVLPTTSEDELYQNETPRISNLQGDLNGENIFCPSCMNLQPPNHNSRISKNEFFQRRSSMKNFNYDGRVANPEYRDKVNCESCLMLRRNEEEKLLREKIAGCNHNKCECTQCLMLGPGTANEQYCKSCTLMRKQQQQPIEPALQPNNKRVLYLADDDQLIKVDSITQNNENLENMTAEEKQVIRSQGNLWLITNKKSKPIPSGGLRSSISQSKSLTKPMKSSTTTTKSPMVPKKSSTNRKSQIGAPARQKASKDQVTVYSITGYEKNVKDIDTFKNDPCAKNNESSATCVSPTSLRELRKKKIEDDIDFHNGNILNLQQRLSANLTPEEVKQLREDLEIHKSKLRNSIQSAIQEQRINKTDKWNPILVNLADDQ